MPHSTNSNLGKARKNKKDEYYTSYRDIQNELKHYTHHLDNKIIYCNCDDPHYSNFFNYFINNFDQLNIKKLLISGFSQDGNPARKYEINEVGKDRDIKLLLKNPKNISKPLHGWGDFRSAECMELMQQADIIITNPPFSQFREFLAQMIKSGKGFLTLGHVTATARDFVVREITAGKLWFGVHRRLWFLVPKGYKEAGEYKTDADGNHLVSVNCRWFTNLDYAARHQPMKLTKYYNPTEYPKCDNLDAININRNTHIPMDYPDMMAVPITFMDYYSPEQFEILGSERLIDGEENKILYVNKKPLFARLIIKHKNPLTLPRDI